MLNILPAVYRAKYHLYIWIYAVLGVTIAGCTFSSSFCYLLLYAFYVFSWWWWCLSTVIRDGCDGDDVLANKAETRKKKSGCNNAAASTGGGYTRIKTHTSDIFKCTERVASITARHEPTSSDSVASYIRQRVATEPQQRQKKASK